MSIKLLKVGKIELDEPLFLQNEYASDKASGTVLKTIDGNEIVFLQENKARELVFDANSIAWNSENVLKALIELSNTSDESECELITTHGSVRARFDYANQPVVSGEPLFEGSEYFFITLKFKEV